MIFGLPLTAWGSWIAHGIQRDRRDQEQVKLQTAFFKILEETDGQITPLALSMTTGLSGEKTREFLDQKAKEFQANFEVDAQGDLFYRFNLRGGINRLEASDS